MCIRDSCYVDIASSKLGSGVKDQSVDADKSYVSKVRTGVTGSTVRIVCDLKAKATPELSYSTDGKTMILAFAESGTAVNEPSDKPDNLSLIHISPKKERVLSAPLRQRRRTA